MKIHIDGIDREMTDEEYDELIASGWSPNGEPSPTDEPPASDDAGTPSTDAG